jgi:hypothetical protein
LNFRFFAFDAYLTPFLVALAVFIIFRRREYFFPLIWFGILLYYLEWGIFPRDFNSIRTLFYLPISHWIGADNFLYISVPLVLTLSLFISDGLNEQQMKHALTIAVVAVSGTAFLLARSTTADLALNYIAVAQIGILVLSLWVAGKPLRIASLNHSTYPFSILLVLVGLAALNPTPHYHVSDFFKEQEIRQNLREINAFLNTLPEYPIYAGQGPIKRLDAYVGYSYGYSIQGEYDFPSTRFTDDLDLIKKIGGFLIGYGCGRPVDRYDLWPLLEVGDPDSDECISLYRILPKQDIRATLTASRELAYTSFSFEALETYANAAANAEDLKSFIEAMSLMAEHHPEATPIIQASGLIDRYGSDLPGNQSIDMIQLYSDEPEEWRFDKLLEPQVLVQDGEQILQIQIEKSTEEIQVVSLELGLGASTAYLLDVELLSFAPFDLVRFPSDQIPDSFPDSWNRESSWTRYQIAFVTPSFEDGQPREVVLELVRMYDRGSILFRRLDLIEVSPSE